MKEETIFPPEYKHIYFSYKIVFQHGRHHTFEVSLKEEVLFLALPRWPYFSGLEVH